MTFDEFLAHFPRKKKNSPTDYHVPCPGHDDNSSDPTKFSLHITLKGDLILLKCFAGCDNNRVLSAMDPPLTAAALFLTNGHSPSIHADPATSPEPTPTLERFAQLKGIPQAVLEAEGWRNDEHGIVIPYRQRDGSTWRNRYRRSLRPGAGFTWDGQKDRQLIPYGRHWLDSVMEKGEILCVEGESCAITGRLRGLPCLGIPGNLATKSITTEDLVGIEKLWIVQEPGASGEGFARKMRERLVELGYAGRAWLMRLPAKDLSDLHVLKPSEFWPAIRKAQEEAQDLATSIESAAPAAAPDEPETKVLRGPAIFSVRLAETDWLVRDLFSVAHQHMATGSSQTAKTWLVFDAAVAVAHPEVSSFLGQPVCRHGRACIESWEMGQAEDVRRIQKLVRGHGVATASEDLILLSDTRPTLGDEAYFTHRRTELKAWGVVLYVIDSLSLAAGMELNDNTAFTAWWRARVKPLLDDGITVLWTHLRGHAKPGVPQDRDSASRGATQIRALSTGVLEVRQLTDALFTLRHNKHRDGAALPFGALALEGRMDEDFVRLVVREDAGGLEGKEALARRLLTTLGQAQAAAGAEPLSRKSIEAALNGRTKPKAERVSRKTYEAVLAQMVADDLFHPGTRGNATTWTWIGPPAEEVEDDDAE
jgi:hypothetical protein